MNSVATIKQGTKEVLSYGILNPTNLKEAMEMAEMMSRSTIIPKDFANNPGNIVVAMQWGMELGLAPLQAMQNIAVINGRPSLWGDAMIALVRASVVCEYVKEEYSGEGENFTAVCRVKRTDQDNEEVRTFSMADARQAGLLGKQGPWQQYPKRMLQLRARGFALRDMFADVLKGMASAEEQRDIEERDITPTSSSSHEPQASSSAEPAQLPNYSEEAFSSYFPKWSSYIESGKRTADQVITMIETNGSLTEEQRQRLRDVEAAEDAQVEEMK